MNYPLSWVAVGVAIALLSAPLLSSVIRDISIEPTDPNDVQQFFEIRGDPNEPLGGLSFIQISGEGRTGFGGGIELIADLDNFNLGSNGLLLYRNDLQVLPPPPSPMTTVVVSDQNLPIFPFFFEEERLTFLLVRYFTGALHADLDMEDDQILDLFPWSEVIDGVGIREEDGTPANEFTYATQLWFFDFPTVGFDLDSVWRDRVTHKWHVADVLNPDDDGPYPFDDDGFVKESVVDRDLTLFDRQRLTPGRFNGTTIPEPSTLTFFEVALGGLWFYRRKR